MKRRKSCHHLSNVFNPLPCPTHYPTKRSKNTSLGTQPKHRALSQGWPLLVPYDHRHRSSWARMFAPRWTWCKVLPWEPWALPPRALQRGVCKEPEGPAISQSSCDGRAREQVCPCSSQGHDSGNVTRWPRCCNAVTNLVVPHAARQAALPRRTHPTTQEMGSGCSRRKPGSSQRLPRALQTGLVLRGCLFSSCSPSLLAIPPTTSPICSYGLVLCGTCRKVRIFPMNGQKTGRKQAITWEAACREVPNRIWVQELLNWTTHPC